MDKGVNNTFEISIEKDASFSPTIVPEDDSPGGRPRHARVSKNWFLVDLSAATGLSVVSLRLAEQNQTSLTPPNLRKVSQALGVSIAFLGCLEKLPENTLGQRIKKPDYIMAIRRENLVNCSVLVQEQFEHGKRMNLLLCKHT